jgi:hypothetical protein
MASLLGSPNSTIVPRVKLTPMRKRALDECDFAHSVAEL